MTPLPSAHPWRRFMGSCYEGILLFGLVWFVGYGYSALTRLEGAPGLRLSGFQLVLFVVLGIYFTGFWRNGYRTLPMKTVSLLLVDRNGRPLNTGRALARYLAATLMLTLPLAAAHYLHPAALLLILLPAGWAWVDSDRQALYDRVAGTRLVHSEPPAARRTATSR